MVDRNDTERAPCASRPLARLVGPMRGHRGQSQDRKSTRLNSSHSQISYAVFCLKKKKNSELVPHRSQDPGKRTSRLPKHADLQPDRSDFDQLADDSLLVFAPRGAARARDTTTAG